tara:strand:- start:289 stop:741 length:453 start_codon:yes stop_codon:yes gene_type:complete
MENYIIPDHLSLENFKKLGEVIGLYEDFKTKNLRKKLHNVALEVGCTMKNEDFWCPHEDCLESIESFENEEKLINHIEEEHNENIFISSGILDNSWFGKKKDENTIIIKDIGEIIIPERNTKEEIEKIIEFYRYDIDILYELLDFKEKYI